MKEKFYICKEVNVTQYINRCNLPDMGVYMCVTENNGLNPKVEVWGARLSGFQFGFTSSFHIMMEKLVSPMAIPQS